MNAASSKFILPTDEEEAEIQRGIEMDPDTYDLSDPRIVLRPFVYRTSKHSEPDLDAG